MHPSSLLAGIASLVLLFAAVPLTSPRTSAAGLLVPLPETFEASALDRHLESVVESRGPVALSVAIIREGQVVLARGYGKRSLKTGEAAGADTLFAIGSVSKQFTCAAILLLAEEGKLSVQDKVAKYYPGLSRAPDITLLDLMNHTSGYPDYYPLDYVDRRMMQAIDPDELLRQYAGGPLDFEPGSRYSYSNTGYILLGRILEKVSGQSLREFLTSRLFKPLGMNHTRYEPHLGEPGLATGYATFALSAPEPVAPEAAGWIGAAGGIYSTALDLAKWDLALISGSVLKPASYELMTRVRALTTGRVSEYGCGLSVRIQSGRQVISHNGAVSGFNAWNATVPSTRSAVIMLCNQEGGLGSLPGQVLALMLKEQANVPAVQGPAAPEMARQLFTALQSGSPNRKSFSAEFNQFLTEDRLAGAASRLRRYGKPVQAELLSINERGGMEVTTVRLQFSQGALRTLMYRKPNGLVEQFFVSPD